MYRNIEVEIVCVPGTSNRLISFFPLVYRYRMYIELRLSFDIQRLDRVMLLRADVEPFPCFGCASFGHIPYVPMSYRTASEPGLLFPTAAAGFVFFFFFRYFFFPPPEVSKGISYKQCIPLGGRFKLKYQEQKRSSYVRQERCYSRYHTQLSEE